ncbi:RNA polymerase sigma-70 factor [Carboxylicivirga sp. A043]|uniref:RNA polymerase sigma factor n=1 Tax=Carboxylicivirga litoralis TaxID=2816963 RepID=UPI0021CB243A|nr:RNA polymerase sigma-70 factor [Carboxylicivirga sp. A043]MCU4154352.1 RNA polymerase sigma-70 factor [Carboxylicivirga sp. A043]
MENFGKQSDDLLIRQILDDSQYAFNQLFDKYYDYAFDVACLYCSFQDAEEVISDVFAKLWINRQKLEGISNFKSYLFISLKNQCLNYLRKKKIDTLSIENSFNQIANRENDPHFQIEIEELTTKVEDVIAELPPKCKEAFLLVREEGLKYKEAAKKLSISENTLDVHLKKATKRILEVIRNYGLKLLILFLHL